MILYRLSTFRGLGLAGLGAAWGLPGGCLGAAWGLPGLPVFLVGWLPGLPGLPGCLVAWGPGCLAVWHAWLSGLPAAKPSTPCHAMPCHTLPYLSIRRTAIHHNTTHKDIGYTLIPVASARGIAEHYSALRYVMRDSTAHACSNECTVCSYTDKYVTY